MIKSIFERFITVLMTIMVLTFISYSILMRDPLNEALGDSNFFVGYFYYLKMLAHGDLGISYSSGKYLTDQIFQVFPATLELCFFALIFSTLFGAPLGFLGAMYHDSWLGKGIKATSALGVALPIFWIAPILLYFAAVQHWEIFSIGQYNLFYQVKSVTGFPIIDVWFMDVPYRLKVVQNIIHHLILPVIVLMIYPLTEIMQSTQEQAEKVIKQRYVKVARTRGWSQSKIFRKLILRNTFPTLIPTITRNFTLLLATCMLIENIYSWPGIGQWLVKAVEQQDYNAISAGVMAIGISIMIVNILATFFMFLLDPYGRKGWYAK